MPDADVSNAERAERILDAAMKLIVHYGYDKTTVSDIAQEAHISKGAIYLHWKSKEALFEALILRESEHLLVDLLARMENDPQAGSIFSLFQHAILAAMANPLVYAMLTRDQRIIGDPNRSWNRGALVTEGNLFRREFVRQLQEANVIRADLDADVVAYILSLTRYGFLMIGNLIPADQAPPMEVVGRVLGDLLDRALSPDGGGDREAGKRTLEHLLQMLKGIIQNQQNL